LQNHPVYLAPTRACTADDFDITQIGARTYRFSAWINFGDPAYHQYDLKWLFGDGNSAIGEGSHEHTYDNTVDLCNTNVTLQVLRKSNGTVACQTTVPIIYNPECRHRGSVDDKEEVIPGEWRIDCKIWVDGGVGGIFTTGNVGSRTKSMKKGWTGIWAGKDAEQVWISLEGYYLAEGATTCNQNCIVVDVPFKEENETNSGNVQRNISDPRRVFYEPDELWSTHKIKVNGTVYAYTKNGGKLYLD